MLEHLSTQDAPLAAPCAGDTPNALRALEDRLNRGWQVISSAERAGEPTAGLLRHFLDLLHQYEQLYDSQRAA